MEGLLKNKYNTNYDLCSQNDDVLWQEAYLRDSLAHLPHIVDLAHYIMFMRLTSVFVLVFLVMDEVCLCQLQS